MFEKITENVEIHQTLPDEPNLSANELKKLWDKGVKIIKETFNKQTDKLNENPVFPKMINIGTEQENNPIIESGSNVNGSWRKYANGDMECYGTLDITGTSWEDLYNFCDSLNGMELTYSQPFIAAPQTFIKPNSFGIMGVTYTNKTNTSQQFRILKPKGITSASKIQSIDYEAIGRWK